MSPISRGFHGRHRDATADTDRVPPGQYVTTDFPVLSAGPTPRTPLERWDFAIVGEVDQPRRWNWQEFQQLPHETITKDIHCVTKWSKLDTTWTGVSLDTLLQGGAGVDAAVPYFTETAAVSLDLTPPNQRVTPHKQDGRGGVKTGIQRR